MFDQGKRGPIAAGAETQGNSASGEFWQKLVSIINFGVGRREEIP